MQSNQRQYAESGSTPTWLVLRVFLAIVSLGFIGVGAELRSNETMILGFSIGVISGVLGLWRCLAHPRDAWSACEIQGSAALVAYFGGAIITLQTFSQGDFWQSGYMKHADPGFLFLATVLIVLFQTVLTLLGFYENKYWRRSIDNLTSDGRAHNTVVIFVLTIAAIQVYSIVTNQVGFSGMAVGDGGQVSIVASVATSLGFPVLGICGFALGDVKKRYSTPVILLLVLVSLMEFGWSFNFGRRVMMFSVVIFMMTYFWARAGRSIGVKGWIWAGLLLVFLVVMTNLFIATRASLYADRHVSNNVSLNMFERMSSGIDLILKDRAGVAARQARNFETRFFVIGYLTDLIGGTGPSSALYGTNFITSTINAIPRLILPIKADLLKEIGSIEGLVNPNFGLSVYDAADSLVAMAYADFLWFGVLLYPLAVLVLGIGFAKVTEFTIGMPFMTVYFMAFGFLIFVKTEANWTTFLVDFRNALLVIAVLMLRQFFLASYHGR